MCDFGYGVNDEFGKSNGGKLVIVLSGLVGIVVVMLVSLILVVGEYVDSVVW